MSDPPLLRQLASIASPNAGCLSSTLLERAGIQREHQRSLVARGALALVVPRVFVVGGANWVTHEQLLHAALLAVGTGARLAGRSALEVRGAATPTAGEAWVVRARPTPQPRQRLTTRLVVLETGKPGVIVIDTPRQPGVSELAGDWPVDSMGRSIRQLAVEGPTWLFERTWREADFLGLLEAEQLLAELGRGRAGSGAVRTQLAVHPPRDHDLVLRSRGEHLLLQALLALGLPRPRVNALTEIGGRMFELDFFFPEAQLAVEVDGEQHDLPERQSEDRLRDLHLAAHGIEVLRFSDSAARDASDACAARIGARRSERIAALAQVAA